MNTDASLIVIIKRVTFNGVDVGKLFSDQKNNLSFSDSNFGS